jgi:hypothetical protein
MLAKGLRSHSLYNNAVYILLYINIVYKPRNIPVQVKDECRLLIETIVFIELCTIKEISVLSHFCIGQALSIHCAVTQHMTAVGRHHVHSALTKLPGEPINQA